MPSHNFCIVHKSPPAGQLVMRAARIQIYFLARGPDQSVGNGESRKPFNTLNRACRS